MHEIGRKGGGHVDHCVLNVKLWVKSRTELLLSLYYSRGEASQTAQSSFIGLYFNAPPLLFVYDTYPHFSICINSNFSSIVFDHR